MGFAALGLDAGIVSAYVVLYYSYEPDSPVRQILFLPVAEAAVRYGILGGALVPFALAPFLAWGEAWRADRYGRGFSADAITLPLGVEILVGVLVGWLAGRLQREAGIAEARAAEAEELRDRLGRRGDQLEAVNRVARALGSSLEQEEALDRFLGEVRSVFEFERLAIVLVEGDDALVLVNSGRGAEDVFAAGTSRPVAGSVVQAVLLGGQTIVRGHMADNPRYPEERELARLGLQSRWSLHSHSPASLWGSSRSPGKRPTHSARTRSSSRPCWHASSRPRSRTSARTRPTETPRRSYDVSLLSVQTSSRSSRTS